MNIRKISEEKTEIERSHDLLNSALMMKQIIQNADECSDLEVDFSIINKMKLQEAMRNLLDSTFAFLEVRDVLKQDQDSLNRIIKPMRKMRKVEKLVKRFAARHQVLQQAENIKQMAAEHEAVFGPHRCNSVAGLVEFLEKMYYQTRL